MPGELAQLAACEPIYETLPGWSQPTRGVRAYDDLPREARAYIARLEEITGVPAAIVSTGSGRDETIFRTGTLGWRAAAGVTVVRPCSDCSRAVDRGAVGVGELDAGAVSRRLGRLGELELGPGDRAAEPHHEVVRRHAHAHALVRPENGRRHDLRAHRRQIDQHHRVAIELDLERRSASGSRAPRRVPRQSSCGVFGAGGGSASTDSSLPGGGTDLDRRGRIDDRPRHLPHVVAGMRHHPHFRAADLRVSPDAIDQRGATRRRREQPFEHDQPRLLFQNRLQRLDRLGVGECEQLALVCEARRKGRHQVGCGYHHRCGHRVSVTCGSLPARRARRASAADSA